MYQHHQDLMKGAYAALEPINYSNVQMAQNHRMRRPHYPPLTRNVEEENYL